eukprot:1160098-Pelagomonas_calceolata.AAC.8
MATAAPVAGAYIATAAAAHHPRGPHDAPREALLCVWWQSERAQQGCPQIAEGGAEAASAAASAGGAAGSGAGSWGQSRLALPSRALS